MSTAELNYEIYDKELLAIFAAFKEWRHYLEVKDKYNNSHDTNHMTYKTHDINHMTHMTHIT
jgi:hypothetical protein